MSCFMLLKMLFCHTGGCLWAMDGVFGAFQRTNISIVQRIEYVRGVIPAHDLDRYLLMLKRLSRSKYSDVNILHAG